MISRRLRYEPVTLEDLDAFHALVQDMDGNIMPREWSEERIRASQALFERRGVGLWLAHETDRGGTLVRVPGHRRRRRRSQRGLASCS
jgi:hypothetical protein